MRRARRLSTHISQLTLVRLNNTLALINVLFGSGISFNNGTVDKSKLIRFIDHCASRVPAVMRLIDNFELHYSFSLRTSIIAIDAIIERRNASSGLTIVQAAVGSDDALQCFLIDAIDANIFPRKKLKVFMESLQFRCADVIHLFGHSLLHVLHVKLTHPEKVAQRA